ncbi:uncharacterized protein K460DRAFT_365040 [Cucurbitaria berberidis CBS 394.84]|uniref:Uncharacterized protein n=1 Tax=Cucurbitaria berberidis CBS 394.84 TaxID=1168544 RepID=A0A9P4GP37_9PLEO|nr:uncharacterized protein K460DRAFT_365040 [Cucurbitaria berberidis CBS 394.84]KAF1849135.1 hypothetical protein K460DRAFT_365040 [Cucurbitaria berberidis CBS 394.84]
MTATGTPFSPCCATLGAGSGTSAYSGFLNITHRVGRHELYKNRWVQVAIGLGGNRLSLVSSLLVPMGMFPAAAERAPTSLLHRRGWFPLVES